MKLMEEKDPRFVHIERKIGLFVLFALIGIAAVAMIIAVKQDVFTSKSRIVFITESGSDITEGIAVKFRGFKIGKV